MQNIDLIYHLFPILAKSFHEDEKIRTFLYQFITTEFDRAHPQLFLLKLAQFTTFIPVSGAPSKSEKAFILEHFGLLYEQFLIENNPQPPFQMKTVPLEHLIEKLEAWSSFDFLPQDFLIEMMKLKLPSYSATMQLKYIFTIGKFHFWNTLGCNTYKEAISQYVNLNMDCK
jgi:hypothetical protein